MNVARRSAVVAMLAVVGGCGEVTRHPVPVGLMEQARVPGMPDGVRAWGDAFDPAFQQSVLVSNPQAMKAYGREWPLDVLAISGGGANGAFGAGLLIGWTRHGDRPPFRLVTGVSAGAIIAPFAFLGSDWDGRLREMALSIDDSRVYESKGFLTALTSDSLTDTRPLAKFLGRFYDGAMLRAIAAEHAKGRRLLVSTTNLDAQRPVIWDLGAIATVGTPEALTLFRRVILASAAIPVLFDPVYLPVTAGGKMYDEMHVDGSTTAQVILYGDTINAARLTTSGKLPTPPRQPNLYVIRNARLEAEPRTVEPRVTDIAMRAVATLTKAESAGDLFRIYEVARRTGFQFHLAAVPPTLRLPPGEGFEAGRLRALFEAGYDLGRAGYPWRLEPPVAASAMNNLPFLPKPGGTTGP